MKLNHKFVRTVTTTAAVLGAAAMLTDNRAKLDELAQYLYQKETITGEEFMEILNREPAQAQ